MCAKFQHNHKVLLYFFSDFVKHTKKGENQERKGKNKVKSLVGHILR